MNKPILTNQNLIMRFLLYVEWAGLCLITIATIVAVGQEILLVINNRLVQLHDILLFFIYLEILTMVGLYFTSGKLPVRYPIYIAIVAIARYLILSMKEFNAIEIIWLSVAILVLTLSVISLRYGQAKYPADKKVD